MEQEFRIVTAGDRALQIEFRNEISIETSALVTYARHALENEKLHGVTAVQQAYCSLLLYYRPEMVRYEELREKLLRLIGGMDFRYEKPDRLFVTEIPVLYGGEWGPDVDEVAEYEKISAAEVISRHSAEPHYLYYIGFTPGLPYLGSQGETFHIPRRATPRVHLTSGSVTVWRNQTTVFPVDQPGGWHVIGRTPLRLFDLRREPQILLTAGQWVQFRPIDRAEYDAIDREAGAGTYCVRTYWKEQTK